ncbi:MAG: signal peptide peptidase SppA [Candidatus Rokubacteria bacterium]|nr:signal peptide peptidase SppA [Candidatus Rokubacteria bacterium]
MGSRRRTVFVALGVTAGVIGLFFLTVWVLMSVLEGGGFPVGQKVAVVELEGIIIQSEPIVRELNEHRENPSVRAVVVRVNSPGGVVAPTQEIYSAIQRVRKSGKPVVASLGSVAASGGYYVATAADRIYASPGTLTGSIGVIMQMANVEGLLKKVGVDLVVVKAGQYKDIGNFARAMTPEERRILQSLLDDVYNQFVDAVARGRKLDRATVEAFADGRIVSGKQAQQLKMIDALGGLDEAIEDAARLAGLPPKPRLILPRKRFSLSDLLKDQLGLPLPGASQLLPGFPAFKTPLYLMD